MKERESEYAIVLEPLNEQDGGGWLATVPALPGCVSDGEDGMEALKSVLNAIEEWKDTAKAAGRPIPQEASSLGQWRQRVPRTLHETLKRLAESEGVSLNQFVTAVLAEAVGKRFGSERHGHER
jgi:antitoxin HicB